MWLFARNKDLLRFFQSLVGGYFRTTQTYKKDWNLSFTRTQKSMHSLVSLRCGLLMGAGFNTAQWLSECYFLRNNPCFLILHRYTGSYILNYQLFHLLSYIVFLSRFVLTIGCLFMSMLPPSSNLVHRFQSLYVPPEKDLFDWFDLLHTYLDRCFIPHHFISSTSTQGYAVIFLCTKSSSEGHSS